MANAQILYQGNSGTMIEFALTSGGNPSTGKTPIISYARPGTSGLKTVNNLDWIELSISAAPGRYQFRPVPDMVSTIGTLTIYASGASTTQNVFQVDVIGDEPNGYVHPSRVYVTGRQNLGASVLYAPWTHTAFQSGVR